MSATSADRPHGELVVEGPWMTCEITVSNHGSVQVAAGVGRLMVSLPGGIYQVRCQLGDAIEQKLTDVAPGRRTDVRFDYGALSFRSAAPIQGTSTSREWHEGPAHEHSRRMTDPTRRGNARLFVFVRTVQPERYQGFERGLRLRDGKRALITNFESQVARSETEGYVAYSADLPAGPYVLTFARRGRPARSQPLWLSPGYETQVFVPVRKVPALGDLSLFMAPRGQGFDPGDPMIKSTETVLDGLERGLNLASSAEMEQMLVGKFEHPWLGVLAAHALRRDPSPDDALIQTVISNMHALIPDHPDVRALRLAYGSDDHTPFDLPPLLWASLDIVQRHARDHLETIPPDSPLARIYPRLLQDSPWVAWRRERVAVRRASAAARRRHADVQSKGLSPAPPSLDMPVVAEGLARQAYDLDYGQGPMSGAEVGAGESDSEGEEVALPGTLLTQVDAAEVSRALRIPLSTAWVAIEGLRADPAGKLDDPTLLSSTEQAVLDYTLRQSRTGGEGPAAAPPAESPVERLYKRLSSAAARLEKLGSDPAGGGEDETLQRLRAMADAIGRYDDAVLVVDEAGVAHYVSATVQPITGYAPQAVIRGSKRGFDPLVAALEEGGAGDAVPLPGADGGEILVRVARAAVRSPDAGSGKAHLYKLRLVSHDPLPEGTLRALQSQASTVELYLSLMQHAAVDERAAQRAQLDRHLQKMASHVDPV